MSPGLILYNCPYCGRGRHDGGGGPCHEFLIAGGVGHDVFQEEVLYLLSGGHQVLSLQGGSQIFGYLEVGTLFQYLADGISCVLVSGVEDREFKGGAQAGPGVCGGDVLGQFYHVGDGTTIGAPGEEYHVWTVLTDELYPLVREPLIVRGYDVRNDSPCAQCRPLGTLGAH